MLVGDYGGHGLLGGRHSVGQLVVAGRHGRVGEGRHARVGGDLPHAVRREGGLGGQGGHHRLEGRGGWSPM